MGAYIFVGTGGGVHQEDTTQFGPVQIVSNKVPDPAKPLLHEIVVRYKWVVIVNYTDYKEGHFKAYEDGLLLPDATAQVMLRGDAIDAMRDRINERIEGFVNQHADPNNPGTYSEAFNQ
jgi:hypothetical protein